MEKLVEKLNAPQKKERLAALRALRKMLDSGKIEKPVKTHYVNNHIHTTYSFSPYSPTKAVWMAYMAGLATCGIIDHDSMGGAKEFIEAGRILDMATTVGVETRVSMKNTPLAARRINNPDQVGNMYILMHGVPHNRIDEVQSFFAPYRRARCDRDRRMTGNINRLLEGTGIALDFDRDVIPLSEYPEGSVTERHITFALAKKVIARCGGAGEALLSFVRSVMGLTVSSKIAERLTDRNNSFVEYDLLGLFKSEYVPKFFIEATDELPDVRDFVALGDRVGGIVAYTYLGDVTESVTGDKKAQKFEDEYLDEVFDCVNALGIHAIAYMPSRNTDAQLDRLRAFCEQNGKMQISGEDINQPRQSFICKALDRPDFANLIDGTYSLIGHEIAATANNEDGIFSAGRMKEMPELEDRLRYFERIGRNTEK
ncbi:MAG: PHP domain-containing protein [Eubacteriales bacterium]|nr:PHP domain-containing protein [Eubacteriales bacterium]